MGTWWIDKPRLLGSSNPTDEDLAHLKECGFNVIVSLLDSNECSNYSSHSEFRVYRIPVPDFHAPTRDQLDEFISILGKEESSSRIVVHCEGGIGRTGTMAAAYWIHKGIPYDQALSRVRATRSWAVESEEQEEALREYAGRIRGE